MLSSQGMCVLVAIKRLLAHLPVSTYSAPRSCLQSQDAADKRLNLPRDCSWERDWVHAGWGWMNIGSQQTCRPYSVRTPSCLVMSTTRMERSLETVSSFRRVFGLFKEYLKHLGVFSSTIAVVLMACALKGKEEIRSCDKVHKFNGLIASLTVLKSNYKLLS